MSSDSDFSTKARREPRPRPQAPELIQRQEDFSFEQPAKSNFKYELILYLSSLMIIVCVIFGVIALGQLFFHGLQAGLTSSLIAIVTGTIYYLGYRWMEKNRPQLLQANLSVDSINNN